MGIVNHTGAITSDETWANTDENHITGSVYFNSGASGAPIVITIENGQTIYYDGNHYVGYSLDAAKFGKVDCSAGTEAAKIIFQYDPTTDPTPEDGAFNGFLCGYNTIYDLDWVYIKHCAAFIRLYATQDAVDSGIAINNCACEYSTYVIGNLAPAPEDIDSAGFITIDGLYVNNIVGSFLIMTTNDLIGPIGTWNNIAIQSTYAELTKCGDAKFNFDFNQLLIGAIRDADPLLDQTNKSVGEYHTASFTGLWITEGIYATLRHKVYFTNRIFRGTLTVEDSVFYDSCERGVNLVNTQTTSTFVIQHCDFIDNCDVGLVYYSTGPSLTLDNLYFRGNYQRDFVGASGSHQDGHWYDMNNAQSPTNIQATPIFPLNVENVVEGTPGASSITITFDAASGATGKRLPGIGFIKYGDTSGTLDHIAGAVPVDETERFKAFAKWTSTYGTFKETGHSVTVENLRAGTKYYYKCCFIDPLGRVAEGTEGDFTTAAAPTAAGGGMPNIGEGAIW